MHSPSRILVSISKLLVARLEHLLPSIRLRILSPELHRQKRHTTHNHNLASNSHTDSWSIPRAILGSEHSASNNSSKTSKAYKCGGAESALPLTADVVSLVGHADGDIGIRSCRGEEDTEIADLGGMVEADEGEADDGEHSVEDECWAAHLVFVAPPTCQYHLFPS